MAKLKLNKLPKKPNSNASLAVCERYLQKVAEIKKHNMRVAKHNAALERAHKAIRGISAAHVSPGGRASVHGVSTHRRRKTVHKNAAHKKAAHKKSARKRR